jgi:nucleotide-binding universal stress UspA family protein
MYSKILVALDGSRPAEAALAHAVNLARRFDSRLLLLRVVPTVDELIRDDPAPEPGRAETSADVIAMNRQEDDEREAAAYLDKTAASLKAEGIEVQTAWKKGPSAPTILEEAAALQDGLVVLTAYGRSASLSAPKQGVFGGVADRVLRESKVPVLVIRP